MHHRTPQTVHRQAMWVVKVTGPLSLATLVAWVLQWLPDARPFAVLMVYQLLLVVFVSAGAVAAVSAAQLAIQHAFRAGFETGQASVDPGDPDPLPRHRRQRERGNGDALLRLIE